MCVFRPTASKGGKSRRSRSGADEAREAQSCCSADSTQVEKVDLFMELHSGEDHRSPLNAESLTSLQSTVHSRRKTLEDWWRWWVGGGMDGWMIAGWMDGGRWMGGWMDGGWMVDG